MMAGGYRTGEAGVVVGCTMKDERCWKTGGKAEMRLQKGILIRGWKRRMFTKSRRFRPAHS